MSESSIPTRFLDDRLLDDEGKSAAIHFFIYRYLLSSDRSPINFIDLAYRFNIKVPTDEHDPVYNELMGLGGEETRYQNMESWAYGYALEGKLKMAIEHLFKSPTKERETFAQRQMLDFLADVNKLVEEGAAIKELLMLFKTKFSDALFSINTDTFVTPSRLLSELISLQTLNSTTRSALDPSCKSGDLLLAAINHADPKKISITGVESDSSAGLIAEALLRAEDVSANNIKFDSSIDQIVYGSDANQKFDVVVCNPPFGKLPETRATREMHYQLGIDTHTRSEVAYLILGLSKLNSTGRAIFVLPSIITESDKYIDLRRELIQEHGLHAVVLLPIDTFKHARVSTCLLMFDKKQSHDSVCLIDTNGLSEKKIGQDSFSDKAIDKILAFVRDRPNIVDGLARTILTSDIKAESKLNPKNYLRVSKADSLLSQYKDLRKNYLEQFCELERLQKELESLANDEFERSQL